MAKTSLNVNVFENKFFQKEMETIYIMTKIDM